MTHLDVPTLHENRHTHTILVCAINEVVHHTRPSFNCYGNFCASWLGIEVPPAKVNFPIAGMDDGTLASLCMSRKHLSCVCQGRSVLLAVFCLKTFVL